MYGSPLCLEQSSLTETNLIPHHRVLDLRKAEDFRAWHLPGSINLPLTSVGPHNPSPFSDPAVLEAQWVELETIFNDDRLVSDLGVDRVLLMCYNGDTARVATSVLRAKGVQADSVRGGHHALKMYGIGSEARVPPSSTFIRNTDKLPIEAMVSVSTVSLD